MLLHRPPLSARRPSWGKSKNALKRRQKPGIRQGVILFETAAPWASTPWPLTPFSGCGRVMPSGCGWSSPAPNRPSSGKKRTSWYGGRSGSGRTRPSPSPLTISAAVCTGATAGWWSTAADASAAWGRETGGTAYTVRYARQRGLPVGQRLGPDQARSFRLNSTYR